MHSRILRQIAHIFFDSHARSCRSVLGQGVSLREQKRAGREKGKGGLANVVRGLANIVRGTHQHRGQQEANNPLHLYPQVAHYSSAVDTGCSTCTMWSI